MTSLTRDERAALYDWHNARCLRDQAVDVEYWNDELPSGTVLVVGAGTGRVSNALASARRVSVGVDLDWARTRRAHLHRPRHAAALQADGRRLPFRQAFDAVLFPYSVVHLLATPVLREVLAEAVRVLHRQGTLAVDMSLGFRDKQAADWRMTAQGWCVDLGCQVREWMRQHRTGERYTAEWLYELARPGGVAYATVAEDWQVYEPSVVVRMLRELALSVEEVRHGYRPGVRPNRRLVVARKERSE